MIHELDYVDISAIASKFGASDTGTVVALSNDGMEATVECTSKVNGDPLLLDVLVSDIYLIAKAGPE